MGVNLLRHKTCCFTGHRYIPETDEGALGALIAEEAGLLYKLGFDTFLTGGALGFDTLAARELLRMKKYGGFPNLKLVLVLPYLGQESRWPQNARMMYEYIKRRADDVIYTGDVYADGLLLRRDRYMVEHSSHCVAYLQGDRTRGGTAYTVRYARQKGLGVTNLWEKIK